ncbi:MAG: PDZ domain-containing protein [Xanthomonadales bacterium]|nr:PDZ domain-containing protein [Xanthomonadales bacterium]NIX11569.1 PDZ domain-containing protein [Xanthomonadales bacterium]
MKLNRIWITALVAALLGAGAAQAQDEAEAEAQRKAELKTAYEEALAAAESEREAALAAVERAREEMEQTTVERARRAEEAQLARQKYMEAEALSLTESDAELAAMREELSLAYEELRRASREVARVHRELDHPRHRLVAPSARVVNLGDRAVIGVVLGDSDETGVHLLGVSPDGPAERAGLEQGDIIVAIEGEPLTTGEGENAGQVLLEVMEGVNVGDELAITVQRDGESHDYTVTTERREPFSWTSMVRLPSAPSAPGAPVIVERIEIPEIDSEALTERMARIREDLDRAKIVIEAKRIGELAHEPGSLHLELESLSEIGEEAMLGASLWFGLPLTQGLKLASVDEGLGSYFKTDRGVLVLQAREDNELQLVSGDVILEVGGAEVEQPADVMRALRDLESGSELVIDIMRDRKKRSIAIIVPERRAGFGFIPEFEEGFQYHWQMNTD